MKERFLTWTTEHALLAQGDIVVVGVSGGADSMCLLSLLTDCREELGIRLVVCHVHHGIRGASADRDAEFVTAYANAHGLPIYMEKVDVPAFAKEEGMGFEEAARTLRYRAFAKVCKETGATKLAVAHNQNDQAETVLFRMARGTGIRGMAGMSERLVWSEEPKIELVRPLLAFTKAEILEYVSAARVAFCEDETNADEGYRRNRLRHRVLPELTKVNSQALAHIARLAKQMEQMTHFMDMECDKLLEDARETVSVEDFLPEGYRITELAEAPQVLAEAALHRMICRWCGQEKDLGTTHVESVRQLLFMPSGREVSLPYGLRVKRIGNVLAAKKSSLCEDLSGSYTGEFANSEGEHFREEPVISEDSETVVDLPNGQRMHFSLISCENAAETAQNIPKNNCTKWFDYDKIATGLCLRTKEPGDYFVIHPDGGRTTLQDYFVDCKIPTEERARAVLLCDGQKVLWAPGYRTSEDARVGENTKRILTCSVEMR